jgi:glycosyltransferase involved in cell wall biosynthesis
MGLRQNQFFVLDPFVFDSFNNKLDNTTMKVALVHDYINEFGGAERVLLALSELYPDAPIYTSFYKENSKAFGFFKDKKIVVSWAHKYIPFFRSGKLHSPLRFLAPLIWNNFDFSEYDVIISSASWYVTKGFTRKGNAIEICYCHTPPRWLYGYKTSIELQKYLPVRIYAAIVGHFLRMYDFSSAQRVNYFIANSNNVAGRIKKFYRRDSEVVYPPVEILDNSSKNTKREKDYYLVLSRIVGGKGLELAIRASKKLGFKLKVAGESAGWAHEMERLKKIAGKNVEFLGYVSNEEQYNLYANAKAFFALSEDEDFGITPVESMSVGTPVIAFAGGGYLESVVEGKTGVFFNKPTVESLVSAIEKFEKMKFSEKDCKDQAKKFSKERFKREIEKFVNGRLQ